MLGDKIFKFSLIKINHRFIPSIYIYVQIVHG